METIWSQFALSLWHVKISYCSFSASFVSIIVYILTFTILHLCPIRFVFISLFPEECTGRTPTLHYSKKPQLRFYCHLDIGNDSQAVWRARSSSMDKSLLLLHYSWVPDQLCEDNSVSFVWVTVHADIQVNIKADEGFRPGSNVWNCCDDQSPIWEIGHPENFSINCNSKNGLCTHYVHLKDLSRLIYANLKHSSVVWRLLNSAIWNLTMILCISFVRGQISETTEHISTSVLI